MAKLHTARFDLGADLDPELYGQRWSEIATNDAHDFPVITIPDGSTRVGFHGTAKLPSSDLASFANPQLAIYWATAAITGNLLLDWDASPIADGESLDPSSPTNQGTSGNIAAPGTTLLLKRSVISITGTYAPDDLVLFSIYRDLAASGTPEDTIADEVHIIAGVFEAD